MHLTWQPGDPVVQLDFPNPLNVSVQLGDIAYFSNPIAVGIDGIPQLLPYATTLPQPPIPSGVPWTSTTTPHLTNEQQHIKMIGEIIQIIPWDGTVSSIICNMPQDLFNQYFAEIIAGGCVSTSSGNPICTGNCCNFTSSYSLTVAVPQTPPISSASPSTLTIEKIDFFFNNPTLSMGLNALGGPNSYMVHAIVPTPGIYDSISVTNNWCLLENNHPNYVPGYINFWQRRNPFNWTDENGLGWGPFDSANILIDFLIGTYPAAGFFLGMNYLELITTTGNIPNVTPSTGLAGLGGSPITGTYSDTYTETCTRGSFIMFSKDNKVNMASILGYYASVEFRNSSQIKSEIFNVGTSFFESSK